MSQQPNSPLRPCQQAGDAGSATNGEAGEDAPTALEPVAWIRQRVPPAPAPDRVWPTSLDSAASARKAVVASAQDAGATPDQVEDIRLAVGEALNNAILHAYADADVRGGTFTVSTARQGRYFMVWVGDEGRGANGAPSSGLGIGLRLMAELTETIRLGVLANGRTQVEMRFAL
jgi:serine/threonine-protein kinase RsbW